MNERERLIELIYQNSPRLVEEEAKILAKRLIANGVTVQEWIPASEPPEEEGEHLLVCYSDGWICDQCTPLDAGVTHWMPMPEPPKGEPQCE